MNKCEVIKSKEKCGKEATFIVRHRDHSEDRAFNVCKDHIPAYKYKIDPRAEGSFIVRESAVLTGSTEEKRHGSD